MAQNARVGSRKCPFEEDLCRRADQSGNHSGSHGKKVVKPSLRKKMAYEAVQHKAVSIRFACAAFQISETCYRYQLQLLDGNALISRWLLVLTQEHRDWGFGLCFAYIRNVQGLRFNHKRVYRIYCELALNLRIKPKRRIKRPVRFQTRYLSIVIGSHFRFTYGQMNHCGQSSQCHVCIPHPAVVPKFNDR